MNIVIAVPPKVLDEFQVADPVLVAETAIATIWKVRRRFGDLAALKIYRKPTMGNERTGFSFLAAMSGRAAVEVYQTSANVALIEWLDGGSLGDLTRSGQDQLASRELVAVANRLHVETSSLHLKDLPVLERWFKSLFELNPSAELVERDRHNLRWCQQKAQQLLSSQQDIRPLHGDLHHDNVMVGTRGYCAFDAKGVLGERCYELANAFRNPKGAAPLVGDPARIRFLADLWSQSFEVDRQRLLEWAAVKSALSIAWRSGPEVEADAELGMLATLINIVHGR